MFDMGRTIWVWSELGYVYCIEEGDYSPTDMEINIYTKDANEYINLELEGLQYAGYQIKVGRPSWLSDNWKEVLNQ